MGADFFQHPFLLFFLFRFNLNITTQKAYSALLVYLRLEAVISDS
jgi:hypothetical protein